MDKMELDKMERVRIPQRFLRLFLAEPPLRLATRAVLKVAHRVMPDHENLFRWAADFDALPYTPYGVGLQVAARYARQQSQRGFTAIEFGVAGGNGLVAMSHYAQLVSRLTGLEIQVVGFDAGQGLPETGDGRDAPWRWNTGDFPCEVETLRQRLPYGTELILGRIEETFPLRLRDSGGLPIGFISVDVDYYSSAKAICAALGGAPAASLLPMIECYFDDCLQYLVPRKVGEAAAIAEFNATQSRRFFDRDDWLSEGRPYSGRLWLRRMYTFYCLDHPAMQTPTARAPERLDLVAS